MFYSPLRYPGGTGCIFKFVSNLFYENGLIGISYAEPYAGGAGLALRLLFEGYVDRIYINDYDRAIYAFWYAVLNRTEEFCDWIRQVEVTVPNWRFYKEIQKHIGEVSLFELAKSTFFLNRTNVSGVLTGGIIGGIEQTGKYKIDARFNKDDLIERIIKIASLKSRIFITNLDGLEFIRKLDKKVEDIFIYLDPPYLQKGADLYMNFFKEKDHKKLAKQVSKLHQPWMVSYDNHDFIIGLYEPHEKIGYKLSQCASNRVGDEILVFSSRVSYSQSIAKLNSAISLTS